MFLEAIENALFRAQYLLEPIAKQTQSIDIHDVLNPQGFAMHYRAISNRGSHFEVFERGLCLRILKHGDPVGNQRIVGLFYYIYLTKLSFIRRQ